MKAAKAKKSNDDSNESPKEPNSRNKGGRPKTKKCSECETMETSQWRKHNGKVVCNACKMRIKRNASPKKRDTSGWTPEKRAAASERAKARHANGGFKPKDETKKPAKKPTRRKLAWTTPPTGKKGKGKTSTSDLKPTQEQPKTRPVNDMFSDIYDAMATAIGETSMADINSILEAINATEAEKEMATEVATKLMRAAAAHAANEFHVGEGKNPTLLCLSEGAPLPTLDILRAY